MPSRDVIVLLNDLVQLVSRSAELRTLREALEVEQQRLDLDVMDALRRIRSATDLPSVHRSLAELEARYYGKHAVLDAPDHLPALPDGLDHRDDFKRF